MISNNLKWLDCPRVILTLLLVTIVCFNSFGQDNYQSFYSHSLKINNTGMYVLGSWAALNIVAGAYGWVHYTGDKMYFNQMNLFWNVINLSIAGFALYSSYNTDLSMLNDQQLLSKHLKTENLFLINSALDVGYIGAGFLLRHLSIGSVNKADLLKGYGSSVILQGGFLLVFDLAIYGIMRYHRMDFMEGINLAVSPESITLGLRLVF